MMIELRPAIYIVMACAFGGCADEHNYCDTEQGMKAVNIPGSDLQTMILTQNDNKYSF